MKKYFSGQIVEAGLYVSKFDVQYVSLDNEALGGTSKSYIRLHPIFMMLLAPILGGIFVISFPLIVIGMVLFAAGQLIAAFAKEQARSIATLATFNWTPNAAFLVGKPKEKKEEKIMEQE